MWIEGIPYFWPPKCSHGICDPCASSEPTANDAVRWNCPAVGRRGIAWHRSAEPEKAGPEMFISIYFHVWNRTNKPYQRNQITKLWNKMTNRTEQIIKKTRKFPELSQKLLRWKGLDTRHFSRSTGFSCSSTRRPRPGAPAPCSSLKLAGLVFLSGRPTTSYAGAPMLTVLIRNSIVDWCVQRVINMRCLRPIHTKWKTSASSPQAQVVCTCETMARVSKSNSVTTSRD